MKKLICNLSVLFVYSVGILHAGNNFKDDGACDEHVTFQDPADPQNRHTTTCSDGSAGLRFYVKGSGGNRKGGSQCGRARNPFTNSFDKCGDNIENGMGKE
jgi:hypothetical protein